MISITGLKITQKKMIKKAFERREDKISSNKA
jgi:hypothetical protein